MWRVFRYVILKYQVFVVQRLFILDILQTLLVNVGIFLKYRGETVSLPIWRCIFNHLGRKHYSCINELQIKSQEDSLIADADLFLVLFMGSSMWRAPSMQAALSQAMIMIHLLTPIGGSDVINSRSSKRITGLDEVRSCLHKRTLNKQKKKQGI